MRNKIVFVGCHEIGYPILKALLEFDFKPEYLVTISQEKAKEMSVSGYFDFKPLANEYKIPIYEANKYSLKDERDIGFFKSQGFNLLIQGGWQRLFPNEILESLAIGAIGVHGSFEFLPFGRGRSPINWSLIDGKSRFIFHFFLMKPGVDDGDVFAYKMVDINPWDDCHTIYLKNAVVTNEILREYIPKLLDGDFEMIPQKGEALHYSKRTPEMGKIDWAHLDLFQVYNLIRALTKPYPGAFSIIKDKQIRIWKAQPFDTRIDLPGFDIGVVTYVFDHSFVVKCLGGLLLITNYDFEGEILVGIKLE